MPDIKITDLVDKQAFEQLKNLDESLDALNIKFVNISRELVKGINFEVNVKGDLDKLNMLLEQKTKEASEAVKQYNEIAQKRAEIINQTTPVISRNLDALDKQNQAFREEYKEGDKVKQLLEKLNGSYQENVRRLLEVQKELDRNKKAQKAVTDDLKHGMTTQEQASKKMLELTMRHRELSQEKHQLTTLLKNEEREMGTVEGSYANMSQKLELLKKAYKDLTDEEKKSPLGQEIGNAIRSLNQYLVDEAAAMGEFQRNVGNYAIATHNGVASTEDLNRVLQMNTTTVQDCIAQNKALEESKRYLDRSDKNYEQTLNKINTKIAENKRKILDVDAVMKKEATTVAEAEQQNKHLAEALKLVDLHSAGAQEKIKAYNEKIERNNKLIRENTRALQTNAAQNEQTANGLLSLIGLNTSFGSSLVGLNTQGNVFTGLSTKVSAFGKTVLGLLKNPWVLSFLGIAGVAAGFKWWYDYNKGLIEASRLTEDFTGKTGDAMKSFRSEVQAVADTYGKDFKEVLQTADALAANFGISFDEALQAIRDGFTSGADVSGNMLSKLQQYPAYFNEAGLSVKEFTALVSQTRNGIFGDKGLEAIKMAVERIRRMPKATAEALDSIGMSSEEIQKGLTDGTLSMMDVIRQVSEKLRELPDNSQQVGEVMREVFGKKGADAGLAMMRSLADININLDEIIDKAPEANKIVSEQERSQERLNKVLAAVFDSSGGAFERMVANCKIFINDGLEMIIRKGVDVINWFIRMYNNSVLFRGSVNSIVNAFKNVFEVVKLVFTLVYDSFKNAGKLIEAVFTGNFRKIPSLWAESMKELGNNIYGTMKNIGENTARAFNDTFADGMLKEIDIDAIVNSKSDTKVEKPAKVTGGDDYQSDDEKKAAEQKKKELEKQAKEQLKILQNLEESTIAAMKDGYEKQIATIRLNYRKKLDEIKGNSENEKKLRIQLLTAMSTEIQRYTEEFDRNAAAINLQNSLELVKEGSDEERDLKIEQLEKQREEELREAEKTGADKVLIEEKYLKKIQELREHYADKQADETMDKTAGNSVALNDELSKKMNARKMQYAKDLTDNTRNAAELEKQFTADLEAMQREYQQRTLQGYIDMYNKILESSELSAEKRKEIEKELADKQCELNGQIADAAVDAAKEQQQADDGLRDERLKNISDWVNRAKEAFSAISDLANALLEAKINAVEEEQEANEEAGSREQERISELVEKKVITTEEGEARKRAAEAVTSKRNEELEKKKQKLQYQQAIWQKANNIAQIGIATALGIMQALAMWPPNIPLSIFVGAMGALQLATVLATPIPKYAKGTVDGTHPGGPAIVGDGGKHEVVVYDGRMWITDNKPQLVDLPEGSTVFPDADRLTVPAGMRLLSSVAASKTSRPNVVVNNDFRRLEDSVKELTSIVRKQSRQQHSDAQRALFDSYVRSRL